MYGTATSLEPWGFRKPAGSLPGPVAAGAHLQFGPHVTAICTGRACEDHFWRFEVQGKHAYRPSKYKSEQNRSRFHARLSNARSSISCTRGQAPIGILHLDVEISLRWCNHAVSILLGTGTHSVLLIVVLTVLQASLLTSNLPWDLEAPPDSHMMGMKLHLIKPHPPT
jgi:hypothetical protein